MWLCVLIINPRSAQPVNFQNVVDQGLSKFRNFDYEPHYDTDVDEDFYG
jgi:hypothetical protein